MSQPNLATNHEDDLDNDVIVQLPDNFFPPCWTDDTRMSVLFAPFRAKSLNPINYESKQVFWRNLIRKYGDTKGSAQLTLAELRRAFNRNGKKPYALETVLLEMDAEGEVVGVAKFMEPPQHTWRDWAHRSLSKVVSWPLNQVVDRLWIRNGDEKAAQGGFFVVRSVVKDHADLLQKKLSAFVDQVLYLETIYTLPTGLTEEGLKLAIHHLQCTKRAALSTYTSFDGQQKTLLKIAGPNKQVTTISEHERNLFDLNQSVAAKTKHVEALEQQIQEADAQLRQLVREKKQNLAKIKLRQKKALEVQLEKSSTILMNIQSMIASIDDSKQTSEIMSTYQLASSTLRKSYAESGITADTLDECMADVQETLDDHSDVQNVLTTGSKLQLGDSDDSALEKELDELVLSDERERDKNLDESIERRLHDLQITGFADLTVEEQRQIIGDSVGSLDELLKIKVGEKRLPDAAKEGAL